MADLGTHDDGLHDCARGGRCSAREVVVEDGRHVTRPAQTYRAFCDADTDRIRDCLAAIPDLYAELGDRIGDRGNGGAGLRVSGGGAAAGPPINLGVEALQDEIVLVLVSWEERVRHRARLSDIDGARRDGHAITAACTVLAEHVDALLALPPAAMTRTRDLSRADTLPAGVTGWVHPAAEWVAYFEDLGGADAGFDVLTLHHRLLSRLGHTPQHHHLLSPCWDCDNSSCLRRWDGTAGMSDEVTCRECQAEYVGERLRLLMTAEEELQRQRHIKEAS